MAESLPEQIIVALKTRFAGILSDGGTNYWFTPDKVVRVPGWAAWENDWFDKQYNTLYFLKAGMRTTSEDAVKGLENHMDVWLIAGTKYNPDVLNPIVLDGEGSPLGDTLSNRLQRDIETSLRQDIQLGLSAFVVNTEITDWNPMTPYLEGWALVEARFRIWYLSSYIPGQFSL